MEVESQCLRFCEVVGKGDRVTRVVPDNILRALRELCTRTL